MTLPPKVFFRIGEVSGLVGVEPHVLRYWEREFRSIRPSKSAKGQRVYSRRDVENLLRVKDLLYQQGFTIAGARRKLRGGATEGHAAAEPDAHAHAGHREAAHPLVATSSDGGPATRPMEATPAHVKEQLTLLRDEVQAFLDELGG